MRRRCHRIVLGRPIAAGQREREDGGGEASRNRARHTGM